MHTTRAAISVLAGVVAVMVLESLHLPRPISMVVCVAIIGVVSAIVARSTRRPSSIQAGGRTGS